MYFCYFDTKFQSMIFFPSFFLHHSAYTSFLCTVLEVMQKLADTPFFLLPAPHSFTTALLRWCTSSGGGAAYFQRPLRPLRATMDRFDQYFVRKSTCCVSMTIRDHSFKTSACLRGGRVSPYADGPKVHKDQNPLHKHFVGMPMVGGLGSKIVKIC